MTDNKDIQEKKDEERLLIDHLKSTGGYQRILDVFLKREYRRARAEMASAMVLKNLDEIGKAFVENQACILLIERIYNKLNDKSLTGEKNG